MNDCFSPEKFINIVMERIKNDTATRVGLARADNPNTEAQSYIFLANYCDITKSHERMSFALVGAALARNKIQKNGTMSLGEALASCISKKISDDSVERYFKRLLSCDTTIELCQILRPRLGWITDNCGKSGINYTSLLWDLLRFTQNARTIKQKWSQGFVFEQIKKEKIQKGEDHVSDKA